MSYRVFKLLFSKILRQTPLPDGDMWNLQILRNTSLQNKQGWMEVLYRTRAWFQCNHGHTWESSWSMILFRFGRDVFQGFGSVRMRRFGQRCKKCIDDQTYHIGFCDKDQAWWILQCLLLRILQKCYEERSDSEVDDAYYIIPVSNVPNGRFGGGLHQRAFCEACAHDRCQEKYKQISKKNSTFIRS